MQNNKQLQR